MKKSYSFTLSLAVMLAVNGLGVVFAQDIDEQKLVELGKKIFFDVDLSVNKTQSCASCHEPGAGFTGPDSAINAAGAVYPGTIADRFGNRKPPSVAYTGESPLLDYDSYLTTWFGGMFWDGRATGHTLGDPLAEQAMGPFLNPLEMAMPNAKLVVDRVAKSEYAQDFEMVWGPGSLDFVKDVTGSFERIARSIAAYERSEEVNPYTSKFDHFWESTKVAGEDVTKITAAGIPGGMGSGGMGGSGMGSGGGKGNPQNNPARWEHYKGYGLTDDELKGLAVFNDPNRGNCASCHTLSEGSMGYPLFTDFGYYNLGIPKNPENPFYTMPKKWNPDGKNWIDYGLGGYLKSAGYDATVYEPEMGKHKTPSLRNIDARPYPGFVRAYGHNGFFKSLDGMEGIVHFYTWRAMMDSTGMGGGSGMGGGMGNGMGGGMGGMTPDPTIFPAPEVDENRVAMQPFNFMMDGNYLVAFLKTLTDGNTP